MAHGWVVPVSDAHHLVPEHTHNKQVFLLMPRRIGHLLQAMGEHLAHYGKDSTITQNGIIRFWDEFGYLSATWSSLHLVSHISNARGLWKPWPRPFNCDLCLKWMTLPFQLSSVGKFALGTMILSRTSVRLPNRSRRPPGDVKKDLKTRKEAETAGGENSPTARDVEGHTQPLQSWCEEITFWNDHQTFHRRICAVDIAL